MRLEQLRSSSTPPNRQNGGGRRSGRRPAPRGLPPRAVLRRLRPAPAPQCRPMPSSSGASDSRRRPDDQVRAMPACAPRLPQGVKAWGVSCPMLHARAGPCGIAPTSSIRGAMAGLVSDEARQDPSSRSRPRWPGVVLLDPSASAVRRRSRVLAAALGCWDQRVHLRSLAAPPRSRPVRPLAAPAPACEEPPNTSRLTPPPRPLPPLQGGRPPRRRALGAHAERGRAARAHHQAARPATSRGGGGRSRQHAHAARATG